MTAMKSPIFLRSPGVRVAVELHAEGFDPWAIVQRAEQAIPENARGAASVFVGRMREFNENSSVTTLFLEHYPGMTERELGRIVRAAEMRWPLFDVHVSHRVGYVRPGDALVLVATWSVHRVAARDACNDILERLKHEAPFWKRERLADGAERWLEHNTPGS